MTSDPRDYKLEISSLGQMDTAPSLPTPRPFLSVLFECCGVYQRVYRDSGSSAYNGRCPRCGQPVTFRVGASGTSDRFFRVR
ncbi:MAG TPA: hypothetical protein VK797_03970 [Tepidisphaeraceae bacterium]|jgi:hypothetical protein|nr:hypothetical protein [Tepidisphaeraceae bacterium]